MLTARVLRALVLCLMMQLTSCALLSVKRPDQQQIRLSVVTTPGAMDACVLSRWIVPDEVSADQAATLALAARKEGEECAERHRALISDVERHNKGE